MRAKFGQMIFFAVLAIILYERKPSNLTNYIIHIRGVIAFYGLNISFASIFATLTVFSSERPVFIRERLNNTYDVSAYYVGRSLAYLPLDIILPLVLLSISYFAINLDNSASAFFATCGVAWLGSWMSSAYGFLLSTLFADAEVSMSLVTVLVIPLLLLGGFFAPLDRVHDFFKTFEYLSMFKY